jgi:hypothetical protein
MSLNAGQRHYGGPKARANHAANPDNRLQKLLKGREGWGDIALAKLFIKRATPEELEAVVAGWLHNRRDRFERIFEEEETSPDERVQQAERRDEERADRAQKTARAAQRIFQAILLDREMPNGKRAGNCRLNYLGKYGSGWVKFSKMGKPTQFGDEIGEAKCREAHGL